MDSRQRVDLDKHITWHWDEDGVPLDEDSVPPDNDCPTRMQVQIAEQKRRIDFLEARIVRLERGGPHPCGMDTTAIPQWSQERIEKSREELLVDYPMQEDDGA